MTAGVPGRDGQVRRLVGVGRTGLAAASRHAELTGPVTLAVLSQAEVLLRSTDLAGGFAALLLLGLASTLPLALVLGAGRLARGCAALALSLACVLSLVPFGGLTVAGVVAQLVCVYVLGRAGATRLGGLLVLPYVVIALGSHEQLTRIVAVLVATLASAAAATGIAHHVRSTAQAHSATEQAFADTLLEHAARGERARIARELHDVVAHHISMIAVQAETARLTTPGLPADGATRLLAIGDTARTALTEMRRLLGVLREDADTGVQRQPQPGLGQLLDLVDASRDAAGSSTRLIVSGPITPLDPGIEVTAYRIVQEALTNARRHAPGAAVDVELHYGEADLALRVRDNGPGSTAAPSGHGLLGMRERAATVGGTLRTGPAPGGGFLVEARLPVTSEEAVALP
ncbi:MULTISPECIES: sensor histidine kinase [unclassified Streptomyces]|uniref:sensor histidine kinase n=1 Tax=unclassified Streptomyces TaxID=2593676 RepID=UPI00403CAA58